MNAQQVFLKSMEDLTRPPILHVKTVAACSTRGEVTKAPRKTHDAAVRVAYPTSVHTSRNNY